MTSDNTSNTLVKVLIGFVMLAMAGVLIWLNAGTRLVCERPADAIPVTCTLGTWAFNRIPLQTTTIQGVRSIERKVGKTNTGSSGQGGIDVINLVFVTAETKLEPGYFADFFAGDYEALSAFVRDSSQRDIVLERSAKEHIAGHIAAIFLALVGFAVLVSALPGGRSRRGH